MKHPNYCEVCVIEELQKETDNEIKILRKKQTHLTITDIEIRLNVLKSRKQYLANKIKEILED